MIFFYVAYWFVSNNRPNGEIDAPIQHPEEVGGSLYQIPVMNTDGTVEIMELDQYLVCVVSAEMPAEFEYEALKAQAIVARTYALKRTQTDTKHHQNAVCMDAACCQAYCSQMNFLASGGTEDQLDKIRRAVFQTTGQILTYNGSLIEATYFSCSGGRTEDALAVWGSQIPYLQSVESPGEENATYYIDTVTFTKDDFCTRLGSNNSGTLSALIGHVTYTQGGGVAKIEIGGQEYTGVQVRHLLGLRSTAFVITAVGDTVTVTTKGYGHRVGMSQYGADAMAANGSTAQEILDHYYPGTQLQMWQTH